MAKLSDLREFNSERGIITNLNIEPISTISKTLKFENKNGDSIVITPIELKEFISDFLTNEINLYTDESIKFYKEELNRRFDVGISNLEGHIDDKIIKMTQDIISSTTSRLINEEVNRRVDEKLRKIRKAIDESI